MNATKCIAVVLAGGRGERLGALTKYYSKPAVHFGNNYRIIDFTLNNCKNSNISPICILSQFFSTDLNIYVRESHRCDPAVHMLPSQSNDNLYTGTADAVYKNIGFIDRLRPECVLILAGDHIYKMDYNEIIDFHKETGADVTIAATTIPKKDASRFGLLNTDESGRVRFFEEKPLIPRSRLASMGIYVFKWSALKKHLFADRRNIRSSHDFGKDILPGMLRDRASVYAYEFDGYWRDVGTIDSLWEANMEQIDSSGLCDDSTSFSCPDNTPISGCAEIRESIIAGRCSILGRVRHSILGDSVTIGKGAEIVNSVIMPNVYIGNNVKIHNAVIGTRAAIMDNTVIGAKDGMTFFIDRKVCSRGVSLVSPWLHVDSGMRFQRNSHIHRERLNEWAACMNMTAEPAF